MGKGGEKETRMPIVSLAALTILAAGPAGQIRAAHAAGFDHVGLRLNPLVAGDPAVAGMPLEGRVRSLMAETGIKLLETGVFPIKPAPDFGPLAPALPLAPELGGRLLRPPGAIAQVPSTVANMQAVST